MSAAEILATFLAKCDAAFEEARLARLAESPARPTPIDAVESIAAALDAKRQVMRYVPEGLDESDVRPHFGRLLGQIQTHAKVDAKVRAQYEANQAEAIRGRAIALENAELGLEKALAAMADEEERHASAVADCLTHSALEKENAKHARVMAMLERKADGSLKAISAVS